MCATKQHAYIQIQMIFLLVNQISRHLSKVAVILAWNGVRVEAGQYGGRGGAHLGLHLSKTGDVCL